MAFNFFGTGFSPVNAVKQVGSYVNPTGGVSDYDVFNGVSYYGGDRSPTTTAGYVSGVGFGPQVQGASTGDFRINSGQTGTNNVSTAPKAYSGGSGGYDGGSGGGGTTTPAYDPVELGLLDDQLKWAKQGISRLGNQKNIGLENILNSFNESRNQLGEQRGVAERDYNTTKEQTGQDYTDTRSSIRSQAGNQFTSLQRLLGSMGAGRSSAAQIMAPFAVGREAAMRFGDVEQDFGRNQQALDTSWGDTTRQFESLGEQLERERRRKENELNAGIKSNEATLQDQMSGLELQRQQLLGGGLDDVRAAIAPYQSRVQQLLGSIDNLGRQYSGSVKANGNVSFARPDLAQYDYSQFNAPTRGGERSPIADYVSPLTNILGREDEERQLV